jgi:hypothetical protein
LAFCCYYCITISPGWITKVQEFEHKDNRERKENLCAKWLVVLKMEVDAPDLWASVAEEPALPKAASSSSLDNRPFTPAEQNLIAAKLDDIKAYLVEGQQFATEKFETIEREINHLKESSQRLGRKDWLNSLLGSLVGQAISLGFDPVKVRGMLQLAGEAMQSLWGMAAGYLQ